jgi:malonyl-CoA O-methyltransferase
MNNKGPDNFQLNKQLVRSAFDRAVEHYDAVAVLQREIGQRMLERLDLIRIAPQRILDAGAGTGFFGARLSQRYPQSHIMALDISQTMLKHARRQASTNSAWRWLPYINTKFNKRIFVCGDIEQLPLTEGCVDMIFSNLTLQWCNDLDRVFEEFRRILKPGGLLMFSTFGPDTLKELRECWRNIDNFTHVNAFIDMHDIGDALLRHRFSEPVMDVEHITLTYKDIKALMHDLKMIGAHNVTAGRRQTLTGKGRIKALVERYETYRRHGVLPASYEVVYGHAWVGVNEAQDQHSGHETMVPLSQLRNRSRQE